MADIERRLTAATRKRNQRAQALESADEERDEVIREAIARQLPRVRIAELTGLSRQRIDQIRRRARL